MPPDRPATLVKQQLGQLESAGLIRVAQVEPELAYLFRHGLIEQAAHSSLVGADRRRLHRLAGETLAALYPEQLDDLAPSLALHFAAAGDRGQAVYYHRRAARLAQARYANAEAVRHLQAALALLDPGAPADQRAAVLEALADAHGLLGEVTPAVEHYQAALARLPVAPSADPWARVRLHRKLIEAVIALAGSLPIERVEAALRENAQPLAEAPLLADSGPPHSETVRLLGVLAYAYVRGPLVSVGWVVDLDAAERYAGRAVAMAEQLSAPDELSAALGVLAGVLYVRGRLRERLQSALRRLALGPRLQDERERVNALIGAGAALAEVGEYAPAIPHLQQAARQAAAIHAVTPQLFAQRLLVYCWFGLDHWEQVLQGLAECRELAAQLTPEQSGPLCFEVALSATVHALRGEAAPAQALRAESEAIMAVVSGPVETWARQQHY